MNHNKFIKKFLFPHIAIILVLLPISISILIFTLTNYSVTSIISICSYLLAFYTLLVISCRIPRIITFFKKIKNENKYAKIWFSNINLRIKVSLYGSLLWNSAYAILQLVLGFIHKSLWFFSMFGYYLLLALMRFFLADYTKSYKTNENHELEVKKSLLCGYILLFMNLILGIIITFIVLQNKIFTHGIVVTISLATYTFVTFTFAIINNVKFRKYNSLVYSSAKTISLITSTVSMLTLESTMLSTFGSNDNPLFSRILLSCSGFIVIGFAIIMAIIMIVRASKELNKLNYIL